MSADETSLVLQVPECHRDEVRWRRGAAVEGVGPRRPLRLRRAGPLGDERPARPSLHAARSAETRGSGRAHARIAQGER